MSTREPGNGGATTTELPEGMQHMPRLLTIKEVCQLTGIGRTLITQLEKQGRFPVRRIVTGKAHRWLASEVAAWVESRPVAELGNAGRDRSTTTSFD